MQVIYQVIQRHTGVSACLNSWPKIFLDRYRSEHPSRSPIKLLPQALYLGLQKIPGRGILMIPPEEI